VASADYLYRHGTSRKINDIVRDIKDVFKDEELKKRYQLYIFGHRYVLLKVELEILA
jgi:hypothetical protein